MFNGNGYNGNNGIQSNTYNENNIHRLSNIDSGEDPIAQAMGLQQQTQPQAQTQNKNNNYYQSPHQPVISQPQQPLQILGSQKINANGKTISIAISPDGTITITIS